LLFRGAYPRSIFDFVLGLNRWVVRVGAYAALMTREYPPFRLDAGESDPGGLTLGTPPVSSGPVAGQAVEARGRGWGVGRVLAIVLGSLALLAALAALAAGGVAVVFDQTQRDADGYLMTSSRSYSTATYAFVSDSYRAGTAGDWFVARDLLGSVRIRVDSRDPVFVGIGPATAVDSYVGDVNREVATRFDSRRSDFVLEPGGAPGAQPATELFWAAQASGAGRHTLTWTPESGDWRIVLMNADGSRGVTAAVAVGARLPDLLWIGVGLLAGGGVLLLVGGGAIFAGLARRRG
jgi:hypothetical protein